MSLPIRWSDEHFFHGYDEIISIRTQNVTSGHTSPACQNLFQKMKNIHTKLQKIDTISYVIAQNVKIHIVHQTELIIMITVMIFLTIILPN